MRQFQGEKVGNEPITSSSTAEETLNTRDNRISKNPCKYPGIETVIHGNGAVAHVMGHV